MQSTVDEKEDYHYFGTPIEDWDAKFTVSKRGGPPRDPSSTRENEFAVDAQGRRRFHGAFTGGYSAGYFNSVGSAEGWKPSNFRSSRGMRSKVAPQSIETFMDEDEVEELHRERLQSTRDYDTFGEASAEFTRRMAMEEAESYKSKQSVDESKGAAVQQFVPNEVLLPVSDGIGMRLLQKMGWRPGTGIGEAPSVGEPQPSGMGMGPDGAILQRDAPMSSDVGSSQPSKRKRRPWGRIQGIGVENTPLHLVPSKLDVYGLGYDPFRGAEEFRAAKRRGADSVQFDGWRSGSMLSRLRHGDTRKERDTALDPRDRHRTRGIAFGSGVVDDDEDGLTGILEDYVSHDRVESYQEAYDRSLDDAGLPMSRGPKVNKEGLGDRLVESGYSFEVQELPRSDDEGEEDGQRNFAGARRSTMTIAGPAQPELLESVEHVSQRGLIPGFVGASERGIQKFPVFEAPKIPKGFVPLPLRTAQARHGMQSASERDGEASRSSVPTADAIEMGRAAEKSKMGHVRPPEDAALRRAIDTLALQVVKYGLHLEGVARKLQKKKRTLSNQNVGRESFQFLIGGDGAEYYRWKVQQLLAQVKQGAPARREASRSVASENSKDRASLPAGARRLAAQQHLMTADERGAMLGETPLPAQTAPSESRHRPEGDRKVPFDEKLATIAEEDRKRLVASLASTFVRPSQPEVPATAADGTETEMMRVRQMGSEGLRLRSSRNVASAQERALQGKDYAPGHQRHGGDDGSAIVKPRGIVTADDLSRSSRYEPRATEEVASAAKRGIPVRWTEDWRPEPLLCKRFDVPDPWKERRRDSSSHLDVAAVPKFRTDALRLTVEPIGNAKERLGASISSGRIGEAAEGMIDKEDGSVDRDRWEKELEAPLSIDEALHAANAFLNSLFEAGEDANPEEDVGADQEKTFGEDFRHIDAAADRGTNRSVDGTKAGADGGAVEKPMDLFKEIFEGDSSDEESAEDELGSRQSDKDLEQEGGNNDAARMKRGKGGRSLGEEGKEGSSYGFSKLGDQTIAFDTKSMSGEMREKIDEALRTLREAEREKRHRKRHRHRDRKETSSRRRKRRSRSRSRSRGERRRHRHRD